MDSFTPENVIDLIEEERKRLARDIHDGPAQSLTNVLMRLEIVKKLIENNRIETSLHEIERLQNVLRASVNDVRRLIFDLRPSLLEHGIVHALEAYAEHFTHMAGITTKVMGNWPDCTLSRGAEAALFRVYQETLNNIMKHAQAQTVVVYLSEDASQYRLDVVDDGVGFELEVDVASLPSYGLRGMAERMDMLGAAIEITSKVGEGTIVSCCVPKLS